MATATLIPSITKTQLGEHRFVIDHLGWQGYQALLKIIGDQGPRLAYSRGSVELMSPSSPHEGFGWRLGRMVETICEELEIPMRPAGSTTFRREDVDRGAEPDESYYLANAHRIANRSNIDLNVDPPPDLVIEVEITSGILDKLDIYGRLGVPELWRFDGEVLTVMVLGPEGNYAPSDQSLAFPFMPMIEILRFLRDSQNEDESRWARGFRAWVRAVLIPLYQNPARPE